MGLESGAHLLLTLRRPSNVDDVSKLAGLLGVFDRLAADVPAILPLHPRIRAGLSSVGALPETHSGLVTVDPLDYLEFLGLMDEAAAVVTDSGGIQEETTVLGIPCVTVRTATERPIP
jgi:UDP-N-acetylglucosamine 2-epimerase (non-hydrolysing)